jgi:hypothetical protein
MFRSMAKPVSASIAAALAVALGAVSPASAVGPCGNDVDAPAACPIDSPGSYSGTILTQSGYDYYVFYGRKGTALSVTVSDATNPANCLNLYCGEVSAFLDRPNSSLAIAATTVGGSYVDGDGVTVPNGFSVKLAKTGTYYLKVDGQLAETPDGKSYTVPVPYTVQVSATPNVQWPPPCTVPAMGRRTSLARAKRLLLGRGCSVGTVSRKHSKRVRRGDVIALTPASGTSVAYHTPVAIVVSEGRARKPRPDRKGTARAPR